MFSVVTANVNGVRAAARRGGLTWLADSGADVLCLQEVRASDEQLAAVLAGSGLAGWQVAHAPATAAGRAGVAILTAQPTSAVRPGLAEFGDQGRWLEADLALPDSGAVLTVVSAYVHTGEADTERQIEKFAFLDAMSVRMSELADRSAAGLGEAVITGDLNVAHREEDLKNWKGNRGKAGFLPEERAYFDRWFGAGWADLGRRHAGPGPGPYTWWSWRGKAFDLDSGWRIDYLLATDGLARSTVKVEVGRAASYAERWSDHAAVTAWFE
ncbi:exodeoxyribonuclease III [Jatrophihabitans telluris]|uniref:Exodeoxyribonuclease III n=1 Tax=Jatrophihabitans telluris TaxID=2038343 RepID=A0ABY4QXG2_9ACTN|nr:exodeoxyribonuclease III [Jatrophihabitans telluris]UQX87837.1 exodeoxyribonuclease III [Jatrophihabitans telluris]